ncbi:hypothetical protein ACI01nite_20250 [Acetobacter cibinongensis]|uniref:Clostridial hydrophobic W n=1 Tax=Acetobacter cibinongensis TaxID=146475 RepID=A0A0D6N1J9_9PROT|nr:hypothetical protein [Acetobacter cibinongensis]GAN59438.1 hypothetical protein Abci_005_032 [Acetobacter cibinongensis]GBQ12384.1 hypothetical protein AA0482_0233 [Acetobacter cibinongensis NRIC 0482]GEL59423.1 hypothetical protein ACI01nite_20250 [Acetobacter cibinongensis]
MSQTSQTPAQQRISDLKVSGHLMTLQTGLFCVFYTPGQQPPTPAGLPGVRITRFPTQVAGQVDIVTFENDGWLGAGSGAALVRVHSGTAQVMVTIYQEENSPHEAPRLQVVQLSAQANAPAPAGAPAVKAPTPIPAGVQAQAQAQRNNAPAQKPEIGAHIQRRGDVAVRLGEWMGQPGSHAWIEGFGVSPAEIISPADIEYQAVLGKGWLSPWVEGGQYCGSRGMALPILGLCVRLKGQAAKKFVCRLTATFTDGTKIGPLETDEPIEADSLAPLEAFLLEIVPRNASASKKGKAAPVAANAAEAAADLAALLAEDIAELEDNEDDFDLFIEEEIDEPEAEAPRKQRGGRKPAKAQEQQIEETSPAPRAKRGRKPAAAAPVSPAPSRRKAAPVAPSSRTKAAAAPKRGVGRGRKPGSRR